MTTTGGLPINRHWIVMMQDGTTAIDWGDGLFQDIISGEFEHRLESDVSHTIRDEELEHLRLASHIFRYDANVVYLHPLPEPPHRTIE
jgi:hypothetical protein